MKKCILPLVLFLSITLFSNAQANYSGTYYVNGHFFHPTVSRDLDLTKTLTQVGPNRYEINVGDFMTTTIYTVQFEINSSNDLINWTPVLNTPQTPASGFMTLDNPGNFTFLPESSPPGLGLYSHSNFANKYDPLTHTFYMHYGYAVGSTSQAGYDRQIYEKWTLKGPRITSFTPTTGTGLTEITIKGWNFNIVNTYNYSPVKFGNVPADSITRLSDTVMKAWVSYGASGKLKMTASDAVSDSLDGFTYIPVPPVIDTQWNYLGGAGFSANQADYTNLACGSNNIPYVVYVDRITRAAKVKKYDLDLDTWQDVGNAASEGSCSKSNIIMDNANNPVIAYVDSANGGRITVRRFNGSSWVTLGTAGFAAWLGSTSVYESIPIDKDAANNIYVASRDTFETSTNFGEFISVYKFNGTAWSLLGSPNFGQTNYGGVSIAVDKLTNTPYVHYSNLNDNGSSSDMSSVVKFDGSNWVIVGQEFISTGFNGIFYPDIAIDKTGVPYIGMQDDNGFERISVFKFVAGSWVNVGSPRFTNSHSFATSLAFDTANIPVLAFRDDSYKRSGTVMNFENGNWKYKGKRGFVPTQVFQINSLAIDKNNIPMIAFPDNNNGSKISVMAFRRNPTANDSICANANISFNADNNNAGNTYQWQLNTGAGYTNLSNNSIYSGATSYTLSIQAIPSSYANYKYRCIIQNNTNVLTGSAHMIRIVNKWTGAINNLWENPANWSCNQVPDPNTDVLINSGTVQLNSNTTIRTLTISPGATLTVTGGFNLTVTH